MKPFYGIDRTTLKKSTYHEGECFLAATVSEATRQSYERSLNAAEAMTEQTRLPAPLRWAQGLCGWTAALIALGVARALGNVTFAEAYDNAPGLFWTAGLCAAAWAVLALMALVRKKKVKEQTEYDQKLHRLDGQIGGMYRELGVPENAKEVDVVQLTYRWKNGKLKIHTQGMETTPYTNIPMRVFRREDMLCLADACNRYELPIAGMRRLRLVKKPLVIQGWNKEEPGNAPFYKPYKLAYDGYGRVRTRSYGLLELTHEGTDWALWLPPYELNYISALTGLPIVEE